MLRSVTTLISILFCLVAEAATFTGWWKGQVQMLPIVFNITEEDNGTPHAELYSPAQTSKAIQCGEIAVSGDSITIEIPLLNAKFTGVIVGEQIKGTFTQGINMPITLSPTTADAAKLYRPQEPQPPYSYIVEEVKFQNDSITFAGTLTRPAYGTRPGAVILVSGSGAQNRDEELYGHKPFAVIADYLTRAGWAVLRYDDRGTGGSSAGKPDDTTYDYASDAMAAIRYLKSRTDINPNKIGICGHSEGGAIAIINAAEHPDEVAFVITLAAPAVKGRDVMIRQNEMIAEITGSELNAETRAEIGAIFSAIDTINDTTEMQSRLRTIMQQSSQRKSTAEIERTITVMSSPWYTAFIRLDPQPYLKRVKCPMLSLNGSWDAQVDPEQNLHSIACLVPQAETKQYPRLNHMFQESPSKAQSLNYGGISQTISPEVLTDIADFLVKISRR